MASIAISVEAPARRLLTMACGGHRSDELWSNAIIGPDARNDQPPPLSAEVTAAAVVPALSDAGVFTGHLLDQAMISCRHRSDSGPLVPPSPEPVTPAPGPTRDRESSAAFNRRLVNRKDLLHTWTTQKPKDP